MGLVPLIRPQKHSSDGLHCKIFMLSNCIPKFVTKFPSTRHTTDTNMLSSVSEFQKIIWDKWNVRVVIIFSLFLQIFLTVSAPSRKRTRSFFVFFVWLAYLLADWAAAYCIGLISSNQEQKSSLSQNDNLMAFWGPFLLLHLGGPDAISAFAMEDNELWLRHLLSLIFQSVMAAYVFLLTLPRNTLWIPTILMFVAGLIKYAERTHALYVAAVNNFRESLLPCPDPGPNYAKLVEEYHSKKEAGLSIYLRWVRETPDDEISVQPNDADSLQLARSAFTFFNRLQGLIVDRMYSSKDITDIKAYFQSRTAQQALVLIEIELNFMYEIFYTKASVVRQYWFWSWGKFVSVISIIAASVLFIKAERQGGFDQLDVRVTYALLSGAVVLDFIALVMRLFSDYAASLIHSYNASFFQKLHERILAGYLNWRKPTWSTIKEGPYKGCEELSANFLFRKWSGSISGHNLLKYCLDELVRRDSDIRREYFRIVVFVQDFFNQHSSIKHLLDRWRYPSTNPFLKELWEYIHKKMSDKSTEAGSSIKEMQIICSERGERVVQEERLKSLKAFVDPDKVSFDESILLWHIATTLCYYAKDATLMEAHKREIKFSMILSDYMLYLLMMQPNMMSSIAGNGQIRFQDTCEEAKRFFKEKISAAKLKEALAQGDPEAMLKEGLAQGDQEAMLKNACKSLMKVPIYTVRKLTDVKGGRSKSLLFDACRLAGELEKLKDEKWEIMTSVWVDLLSYAAFHCRPMGHVQLLSKGGELISFVWLSMAHCGLSPQFQALRGVETLEVVSGRKNGITGEQLHDQEPIGSEEDPAAPGIRIMCE